MLAILVNFKCYLMQKILKNNFNPFLSYNDYKHGDQNHLKPHVKKKHLLCNFDPTPRGRNEVQKNK
jgi:hypothetical protein